MRVARAVMQARAFCEQAIFAGEASDMKTSRGAILLQLSPISVLA